MRFDHRQLFALAAFICVTATVLLYLASGDSDPEDRQESIDLALVQEMLSSARQTHMYRMIPDSVMTGLCWRTADGVREGVFRDVNAGMAHWRDQAPSNTGRPASEHSRPAPAHTNKAANYASLFRQLERMTFEATSYDLSDLSARVTGELVIGAHRREVVLRMKMPASQVAGHEQNVIALKASTELTPEDLGNISLAAGEEPLNLCITMQAVKESILPDPYADKPLRLSHYYQ